MPAVRPGDVAPNVVLQNVETTAAGARTPERFELYDRVGNQYLILEFYPHGLEPRFHPHLQELEGAQQELQRHGGQVAVVAAQPLDQLRARVDEEGLTFPAAADPDRTAHQAYGLAEPDGGAAPAPAMVVVGPDRVVRYARGPVGGPLGADELVRLLDRLQGREA
ncbi:MAG TPA: redoxin domain-containing protein [Dehalococcoidia bacterium]